MLDNFFFINLVLYGVVTAIGTFGQSYLKQRAAANAIDGAAATQTQSGSARSLWRSYIVVYALVMGACEAVRACRHY